MAYSQKFTEREIGIMLMLKEGFSNQKISTETDISVNTVKYHLKQIYRKLEVQNRVEAINKFNSINFKTYSK